MRPRSHSIPGGIVIEEVDECALAKDRRQQEEDYMRPYLSLRLIRAQIWHYKTTACNPNVPEWYETRRKTTHVIFWS